MKRIIESIYSVAALAIFSLVMFSCDGYLQDSSNDLLIPKNVDEFTNLLYGEGYPKSFDREASWFKLMTDDVEMGYLESSTREDDGFYFDVLDGGEGRYVYLWDYNMGEMVFDDFWVSRYSNILGCNAIIEALPTMTYGDDEVRKYNYLAAQAYTLRAYNYFCLINAYALPYSEENKSKPGVIIRTTPEIKVGAIKRSTIGEVYELINNDIQTAFDYMDNSTPSTNKHLITPAALQLLATRVALFQEQWDKVIKYGELFLQENNTVFDLNSISEDKMGTSTSGDFTMMDIDNNNEIIFTFGTNNRYYSFLSSPPALFNLGFRVSYQSDNSLIKCYEENDLRLKAYFLQDYEEESWWETTMYYCYSYPIKFRGSDKGYRENWRTVEAILNLAEAYARKNTQIDNAISLLNQLREKRIRTANFTPLTSDDFSNNKELVNFIWQERRRELCFEEAMRFWDLRRTGMPRIEHRWYTDKENYELYVLEEKSNNYVVQIPSSETSQNDLAEPNPRDVINPR